MEPNFRASMNWLHTWAGVVLATVLFTIFWMGTLSVFDREIDRWMAPVTRLPLSTPPPLASLRPYYDEAVVAGSPNWGITFPTEREPTLRLFWRGNAGPVVRHLDPATGLVLEAPGTLGGTGFIFPFHYMLHVRLAGLGYWIVGAAAMAMMLLCISGVVIHRKIFADLFTFRRERKARRLILDLHNVTGVLGLPFHFLISLSGLVIFFSIYFPSAWQAAYGSNQQAYNSDSFGTLRTPKAGRPGDLASLDAIAADARRLWNDSPLRYMTIRHAGDAGSVVQVGRLEEAGVSSTYDQAYFEGPTGKLISYSAGTLPVMDVQRFLSGLHFIQFRHWTLRWVYFVLGLAGCVMIATGFLFWLESRRKKHAQLGLNSVRIVEGLAVGSITGLMLATVAFFVANRLLPLGASFAGYDRAALEIWTFLLVWLASFAHASAFPKRAWHQQCRAFAVFAVAAVLLNWLTTGDHLAQSLRYRHLWPVAGMDLLLIAGASIASVAASRLRR